jgi:DedD protein
MRGYFDDEEAEQEEREERGRDTEVTLGAGALLGIFFALVLLCGLFFGLGYAFGHHNSSPAAATAKQPATPTAAPDQEPLQGSGTVPKPSAAAQAPVPQPATTANDGGPTPAAGNANPAAQGTAPPVQNAPSSSVPAAAPAQPQGQVHPAFPAAGAAQGGQAPPAPAVRPALPGGTVPLMVQVAAVSHEEDASVLVGALRRRGYSVSAQREPSDGLIHVRVGPFATRDEAARMARRLLDDGYNAMIQP